jgi:hypothetical protein
MAQTELQELGAMVRANDKLLKALTVLLALKDEHLLEELQTVFAAVLSRNPEMRAGGSEVWDHLRHELTLIGGLVESAEAPPMDGEGAG